MQAKIDKELAEKAEIERLERLRIADLVHKQGGAIKFIHEYRKRRK
jgi:hypothetical protein